MKQLAQLRAEGFAQNHQPGNLDAAAGRPGTGTHDHQQHQNTPAELGPQVKIRCAEARGGNDGRDGEKGVVKRVECVGNIPRMLRVIISVLPAMMAKYARTSVFRQAMAYFFISRKK